MLILEYLAIGWFYLGFAGVVGALARSQRFGWRLALVYALVFLLYSLALPYPWPQRGLVWAAAAAVAARYAGFPRALPAWARSPRFGLGYFALAMLLIIAWVASGAENSLWLVPGIPALCAGLALAARAYSVGRGEV